MSSINRTINTLKNLKGYFLMFPDRVWTFIALANICIFDLLILGKCNGLVFENAITELQGAEDGLNAEQILSLLKLLTSDSFRNCSKAYDDYVLFWHEHYAVCRVF